MKRLYFCIFFTAGINLACGDNKKDMEASDETVTSSGDLETSNFVESSDLLPECNESNHAETYWVEAESVLKVCSANGYVDIGTQGPAGETGQAGESGATGPQGPQGDPGDDANPGIWLIDGNDQAIGIVIDISEGGLMLPTGEVFSIDFRDGTFRVGAGADSGSASNLAFEGNCSFTSNDCSGTCYVPQVVLEAPIKNGAFYTGSSWVKSTGQETVEADVILESIYSSGSCQDIGATTLSSYPFTTSFDPGFTLPLQAPLTLGTKP